MRTPKLLFVLGLVSGSLLFASARCIERDTVRRGPDGDWHIYGEIHNETDIQGVDMLLRGTLFGPGGNVIGTGQARTCPASLSPDSLSVYDIRINDSTSVPQPASHQINVLSGRTLVDPLPKLDVELTNIYSSISRTNGNFMAHATLTPDQANAGRWGICVAFYDAAEQVVAVDTYYTGVNAPPAGPAGQPVELAAYYVNVFNVAPREIAKVRLLIWLEGQDGAFSSSYQGLVTDLIPILE
jgi:hypothetical protein